MKKLLVLLPLICSLVQAPAALYVFTINLNGTAEVPPNSSPGLGVGSGLFDSSTGEISLSVYFAGLMGSATTSGIYSGASGATGPIILPFTITPPSATSGSIIGGPVALPSADMAEFLAGHTYFNIHSSQFADGEIRGQISPLIVPEPSTLALAALGLVLAGRLLRRRA